jgi:hypothetical protein
MAIVEELLELEDTASGVVDFAPVSPNEKKSTTPASPVPAPPETLGWNPSRHGNFAQWASAIGSVLAIGLTLWFHYTANASVASDEHVGTIVDAKLNPAVKGINDSISKQLEPITRKLDEVASKVDDAQGQLKRLRGDVDNQAQKQKQLMAVVRVQDPSRVLATIRAEIQVAQASGKLLPISDVNDYRDAVRALPASAHEYWTTVAAIINYQSLLNQMSGEAPDPATVSKPCPMFTNDQNHLSYGNTFNGFVISKCVVDLDNQIFKDVTFTNSVVRYRGGPVALNGVTFVNCRFVLGLVKAPSTRAQENLLLALFNSPDQKTIQISK